jgi:hypothetical protein
MTHYPTYIPLCFSSRFFKVSERAAYIPRDTERDLNKHSPNQESSGHPGSLLLGLPSHV